MLFENQEKQSNREISVSRIPTMLRSNLEEEIKVRLENLNQLKQ
jgi:hypothetical protein